MPSKKLLILFLIPILGACQFIVPVENDLVKDGLRGKVATVKENSYRAVEKFGEIQKGERARKSLIGLDYKKEYNRKGDLETYAEMDSKTGQLVYKYRISYAEKSQPEMYRFYGLNGELTQTSELRYDQRGLLIEMSTYKVDGSLFQNNNYFYNKNKLMSKEVNYRADGSIEWQKSYTYNRHGQVIEEVRDDSDNRFDCTYIYVYNKKERLKEEIVKDINRIFDKRYTFEYDRKGNKTVEKSYNSQAQLYSSIVYTYDRKGNKLTMNVLYTGDDVPHKFRYRYTYDKKGNWLTRIEYHNDSPTYIVERDITYHKGFNCRLPYRFNFRKNAVTSQRGQGYLDKKGL